MKVIRIERLYDTVYGRGPLYDRDIARRRLHVVTDRGTFALDARDRPCLVGRNGARVWHWCISRGPYGETPPCCLGVHVLGLSEAVAIMASGRKPAKSRIAYEN